MNPIARVLIGKANYFVTDTDGRLAGNDRDLEGADADDGDDENVPEHKNKTKSDGGADVQGVRVRAQAAGDSGDVQTKEEGVLE